MKLTMTTLLLPLLAAASLTCAAAERPDSLRVMFWNAENFFDYRSPSRPEGLTRGRFFRKCNALSKMVLRFADRFGSLPDVVALAEVENLSVLRSLVGSTLLRKLDYEIVHYDSPDHRGIDCALLYRRSTLELKGSRPVHVRDSSGRVLPTRDILLADFGDWALAVNHHPSKIGGKTDRRQAAFATMLAAVDSLLDAGSPAVVAVGDFNDSLWGKGSGGTIKYNGEWEKIDGFFLFGEGMDVQEQVFAEKELLEEDRAFGGEKPRRTFIGPRYNGGVSDHLPIVLTITFRNAEVLKECVLFDRFAILKTTWSWK